MAQLSFGLSTEYSKKPAQQDAKSDKVDADRQLYAKYYVSQIMQLGEEGIRDAWSKVSCCSQSNLVGLQGGSIAWRRMSVIGLMCDTSARLAWSYPSLGRRCSLDIPEQVMLPFLLESSAPGRLPGASTLPSLAERTMMASRALRRCSSVLHGLLANHDSQIPCGGGPGTSVPERWQSAAANICS